MHFDSIEEKIIFEKLADGLIAEASVCAERLDIDDQINQCLWAMNGNEPLIQGTVRGYIDPTVGLGPPLVVYSEESIWMGIKRGLSGVFVRPARKLFAASIVSVKKLVLKFVRWYVQSIFNHQLEFNRSVVGAVDRLAQLVEEHRLSLIALQDECKKPGARVDHLESNINNLESSIGRLAAGHASLESSVGRLVTGHENLESSVGRLTAGHESLETSYGWLAARHENLESSVGRLTAGHESLETSYGWLAARHENLESSVGRLAAGHESLETSYGQLAEGHSNLEQRQDRLNQAQSIGSGQIAALQETMDRLRDLDIDIFAKPEVDEQKTFSQAGEDVIASWLLRNLHIPLNEVVYLDLGANHAKILSNTYHFYLNGAKGVLVEANPALIPELKFYRPRDVILNYCVTERSDELIEFNAFELGVACGDGLSTTDRDRAEYCLAHNADLKFKESVFVKSITIEDLIEKHLCQTPTILNIDIEGDELKILKTIDFTKYRPLVIIIEMIPYQTTPVNSPKDEEIMSFMQANGYVECAFTGVNSIFLDGGLVKREGTE